MNLAPNGKKSNLTNEQYRLVRTFAFKKWFGDWEKAYETGNYDNVSKVIDEETKEPLVMYHGSPNYFTIFNAKAEAINRRGNFEGFYFTSNKDRAEGYSNVKLFKVFLKINKPLYQHIEEHLPSFNALNYIRNKYKNDFNKDYLEQKMFQLQRTGTTSFIDGEDMTKILIMDDYDGVFDGSFEYGDTVAFYPNQIKLADGTNTTFDSNNPDIRYKNGGGVEDYAANNYLQKKYKNSAKKNAKFEDLPEIYIRIGLPKKVKDKYLPSRNHYLGILEDGISVFTARYSPNSKFVFVDLESDRNSLWETYTLFREGIRNGSKDKMYLLEGNALKSGDSNYQVGADDERLLNTKGVKVIGELNPKKIIIYDKGTPLRDNKSILLFDTETLSGKELKKYPKYTDGGLTIKKPKAKLLASNGNKSNLNEVQYRLVRTPEFKAWFGDWENSPETASKVVDFNGEPLVVYHGSANDFTVFNKSKIGLNFIESENGGFFFTQKKQSAENYAFLATNGINKGFIYQCFLNIKNPVNRNTNSEYYSPIDRYDMSRDEYIREIRLNKKLNGIIIIGTEKDNLYVILNSNQIKLADGTNTTFDSNNPDIRYKNGGNITNFNYSIGGL